MKESARASTDATVVFASAAHTAYAAASRPSARMPCTVNSSAGLVGTWPLGNTDASSSSCELSARTSVRPCSTSATTGAHTASSPGVCAWQKRDAPSNWSGASRMRASASSRRAFGSMW